jgi:hypothetical protein
MVIRKSRRRRRSSKRRKSPKKRVSRKRKSLKSPKKRVSKRRSNKKGGSNDLGEKYDESHSVRQTPDPYESSGLSGAIQNDAVEKAEDHARLKAQQQEQGSWWKRLFGW